LTEGSGSGARALRESRHPEALVAISAFTRVFDAPERQAAKDDGPGAEAASFKGCQLSGPPSALGGELEHFPGKVDAGFPKKMRPSL